MTTFEKKHIPENFSSLGKMEHMGTSKIVYDNAVLHPVKVMEDSRGEIGERQKMAQLSV